MVREQMLLLWRKVRRLIVARGSSTMLTPFTSLHLITGAFIISHHHEKKDQSSKIFWETDHIHITFIIVYYYNYSISLLVIAVNVLLCPIHKLNFITGMYVQGKTIYIGLRIMCGFRHPLRILESIPPWEGGTTVWQNDHQSKSN